MSTHNNYEPTSRVNYERTTPNPYLHDTYLPPPPPEYYMHQRTGKAWKVAIPQEISSTDQSTNTTTTNKNLAMVELPPQAPSS
jgi:hypothetical protein